MQQALCDLLAGVYPSRREDIEVQLPAAPRATQEFEQPEVDCASLRAIARRLLGTGLAGRLPPRTPGPASVFQSSRRPVSDVFSHLRGDDVRRPQNSHFDYAVLAGELA